MEETKIRPYGSETWYDLMTRYGISLEETAVSRLMTPAPVKEYIENDNALEHGKRYDRDAPVKLAERVISLVINVHGSDKVEFLQNYDMFCQEILAAGFFEIKTDYIPNRVFRLMYVDCTQFSEFNMELGKYTLSVKEPDPTNRGANDSWIQQNQGE